MHLKTCDGCEVCAIKEGAQDGFVVFAYRDFAKARAWYAADQKVYLRDDTVDNGDRFQGRQVGCKGGVDYARYDKQGAMRDS